MITKQDIDQVAGMIREARLAQHMTQQQLADKSCVPKYRITKAENDFGEVPISILRTIIVKGLGGQFNVSFEF